MRTTPGTVVQRLYAVGALAVVLLSLPEWTGAGDKNGAEFPEPTFQFGKALRGSLVEHDFVVRNQGRVPLRILKVSMTPPLIATRIPGEIAPGSAARIQTRLDTSQLSGPFDGELLVYLHDPSRAAATLRFEGDVVTTIEVSPTPVLFVVGERGHAEQRSIELINHEAEPLEIRSVRHSGAAFTTRLETLQPGQRYRLTVTLRPDGPGGRRSEPIVLSTSSRTMPSIRITAHTFLRDRVYVFPDAIDLGEVGLAQIAQHPDLLGRMAQTLMIYRTNGANFVASVDTDMPELQLAAERGPQGDRYQITAQLREQGLEAGDLRGSIRIRTNDPEFPVVTVPVSGRITTP